MTPIRLPDPFEPLRCLHRSDEGPGPEGPQPVVLRGRQFLLAGELITSGDSYDVDGLCVAVRTALGRVVVQRPSLSRCGFDQAWERALWVDGDQTCKLWRGLRHVEILGEAERRAALAPVPMPTCGAGEHAALRAVKAMLLGDLVLLGEVARATLPDGEWEPFQLERLLDSSGLTPAPYSTGLIFSKLSPPA